MNLSATASRFDSSISWLAAIGSQAALTVFELLLSPAPSTPATTSSPPSSGPR